MSDCVFCGIVLGIEPAEVVYEDEDAIAFLDIVQATQGHTLVVPREHLEDIYDIGEERAASVMRAAVRVASILTAALEAEGMNILNASRPVAWQSVSHFHLHLVPRYRVDDLTLPWVPGARVPAEQLASLAERIRAVGLG